MFVTCRFLIFVIWSTWLCWLMTLVELALLSTIFSLASTTFLVCLENFMKKGHTVTLLIEFNLPPSFHLCIPFLLLDIQHLPFHTQWEKCVGPDLQLQTSFLSLFTFLIITWYPWSSPSLSCLSPTCQILLSLSPYCIDACILLIIPSSSSSHH